MTLESMSMICEVEQEAPTMQRIRYPRQPKNLHQPRNQRRNQPRNLEAEQEARNQRRNQRRNPNRLGMKLPGKELPKI